MSTHWEPWMGEKPPTPAQQPSTILTGYAYHRAAVKARRGPTSSYLSSACGKPLHERRGEVTPCTDDEAETFLRTKRGLNPNDINARTQLGWSAMHVAAKEGNLPLMVWLAARGADLSARSHTGQTALHFAVQKGDLHAVMWLCRAKGAADVGAANATGDTPMHIAAMKGSVALLSFLSSQGAAVSATDHAGRRPMRWATDAGHFDAMYWLLKNGGLETVSDDYYDDDDNFPRDRGRKAPSSRPPGNVRSGTVRAEKGCPRRLVDPAAARAAFSDVDDAGVDEGLRRAMARLAVECRRELEGSAALKRVLLWGTCAASGSPALSMLEALPGLKAEIAQYLELPMHPASAQALRGFIEAAVGFV